MKSWDLQVSDRASAIKHVDLENTNGAYYNNKIEVIDSVANRYISIINKLHETLFPLHIFINIIFVKLTKILVLPV